VPLVELRPVLELEPAVLLAAVCRARVCGGTPGSGNAAGGIGICVCGPIGGP